MKNDDCIVSENSEKEDIKENCDSLSSETEDLTFVSTTLKSILNESPEQSEVIKNSISSTFKCSFIFSKKV